MLTFVAQVRSLAGILAVFLNKTADNLLVLDLNQTTLGIDQNIFTLDTLCLQGESHAVYAATSVVRTAITITTAASPQTYIGSAVVVSSGASFGETSRSVVALKQRIKLECHACTKLFGQLKLRWQYFVRMVVHQPS